MAFAKVEGILLNNDKIRQEQLKRVYWLDKQYTIFGGDFVRNVSIKTEEVSPIGEGRDILHYTFDGSTDYSKDMLKKYMSNGVNHEIYEVSPIPDGERYRWDGNYFEEFEPDNPRSRVAVAKFNEEKVVNKNASDLRFLQEKYLTPRLLNFYGPQAASKNLDLLDYANATEDKRIPDIAEASVGFIHDYSDVLYNPLTYHGSAFKYLRRQFLAAGERRYVNYVFNEDPDPLKTAFGLGYPSRSGKIDNYNEDFSHLTFTKTKNGEIYKTYDEKDIQQESDDSVHTIKSEDNGEDFLSISYKEKSLLSKTNKMFNEHKIATMIGRFHTTLSDDGVDTYPTAIDSAVRAGIGNSKGRNLLKTKASNDNGYDNPYCRVWTYHHQYDKVSRLIRPFRMENGEELDARKLNPYSATYINGTESGYDYLKNNTVLGKNGFVNITPKTDWCGSGPSVEIKKCMFSIENLAWKDVPRKGGIGQEGYYIKDEQRGPNGGRIMWFPPYDLNFQESVNVNWNQQNFIGRGEPVFTYSNTNRNGVLSFAILVDHPSIIDNIGANNLKEDILSDDDILRYFAGCEIPEGFSQRIECEDAESNEEKNKKENEEPEEVVNEEKGKKIRFNVYFPNNYSGNGERTPKNDWSTNGSSDKYWFEYLLFGEDTKIATGTFGRGYETDASLNQGVTNANHISQNYGITAAQTTKQWKEGVGEYNNLYYLYRIDFDRRQKLENITKEGQDRGMAYSTSNYIDSTSYGLNVKKDNQNDTAATESFSEIMYVLASVNKNLGSSFMFKTSLPSRVVNRDFMNSERYKELVELFNNPKRISSVKFGGLASSQDDANSVMLAERRCKSIEGLIMPFLEKDVNKKPNDIIVSEKLSDPTSNNTLEAKRQKMAFCEIIYDVPEITPVAETTLQPQEEAVVEDQPQEPTLIITDAIQDMRYENEGEYFKNIDKNDPLIHKKLIEKFKYFNPAFHSISPEGFNARLTFLQQCARQGHTIEATSGDFAKTAGNLSFGRMPVCVLRLGDFLNTRMIINGISINYDTGGAMQWDLNPEGIGVQPMYAKVSLQVTILGGQSLEGPINRLQNAVTFNYYANTGVYDNRSDRIGLANETVTNEEVRLEPVETAGSKYGSVTDVSEYKNTLTTYKHVFTPYPKIMKEKDNK